MVFRSIIIIIIIIIITAIEFYFGGSSPYTSTDKTNKDIYRICSRNLRTLAAEKSGCVKYADFWCVEVLIWVLF